MFAFILCIAGDSPISIGPSTLPYPPSATIFSLRLETSKRDILSSIPDFRVASNLSLSHGLGMKSVAPALIALMAFSVSEYAVMKMTTASLSISRICSRYLKPSWPLTASRVKFMSSNITSGSNTFMKCPMRCGSVATLIAWVCGLSNRFSENSTSSLSSMISTFPLYMSVMGYCVSQR